MINFAAFTPAKAEINNSGIALIFGPLNLNPMAAESPKTAARGKGRPAGEVLIVQWDFRV